MININLSQKTRSVGSIPEVTTAQKSQYYPAFDFIKGFAIISVVLVHTIPPPVQNLLLFQFYIGQQVALFFIIMGFTLVLSLNRKKIQGLIGYYSKTYVIDKFWRYVAPFLLIFCISLAAGIYKHQYYLGIFSLMGKLPTAGAGNYFVSMLFQFILISPLIYWLYKKSPALMVLVLFSLDLGFQLAAPHIALLSTYPDLTSVILRYLSAIALGVYVADEFFSTGRINLRSGKNRFILVLFPVAVFYLILSIFFAQPCPLFPPWGIQNILSFAYPFVLTVLFINYYPVLKIPNRISTTINSLGRASYHIFLVQMLYFGFNLSFVKFITGSHYAAGLASAVIIDLALTLTAGYIFYLLQIRIEPFVRRASRSQVRP
jgi:peptidoglycan/LPS O-acetylase OafA/YrhL